jgi:hypothetical protein
MTVDHIDQTIAAASASLDLLAKGGMV